MPDVPSPDQIEHNKSESHALVLTETEAAEHFRKNPELSTAIHIRFADDDPSNPRNWPSWRKWYVLSLCCFLNFLTCLCAGGYSSGADGIAESLHVSSEATTVGLSMYILGFAIGPMVLAPLSEYFGRSPVYICSWFFLVVFQIPLALAPNIGTIIICRLIAGFGGSAPLTNTGGTVSDLWSRNESGYAMMLYGVSSTFSPPMALVISGYIALEKSWHWLFWVYLIVTGSVWIIMILTLRETRHSTILEKKAHRLRKALVKEMILKKEDQDQISDVHNQSDKRGLRSLFVVSLTRPVRFLLTEPITIMAAAYNGFIYGIVYLFNEAIPLVFGPGGHNFNTGEWGLAFLGIAVGTLIAACLFPLQERYYLHRVAENNGKGVPEARMWQARFGAFLLPISLFWFAWTSYPSVHWIVPIIASAFFGAGIYIVILSVLNYVVDSYQTYSASALAGVILVRNVVGAAFPLFASQMYKGMGYEWASSLLAFLSILFIPIPIWWFYRGEQLRLKSPWAREHFDQDEDASH
ncbi:hypothetical protein M409DRAFT_66886 [Zasmidium cellare ATCC 36951]|uniref:Major facilitator superfamily (MFS) profile domain-containing protein n=1 Tax=Zasmidium cellare ATCC 36951 TaxID=1080233 RepID=A0A6A6CFM5_ZASCE|nr:uncharacterized protein M409DRAFT_66886 [Zasmidium cellare ATCC 36951]KAF2165945.1 hypothetical protein M409DRAFT_66886 [Zasmidium cellare ATCC 36951]